MAEIVKARDTQARDASGETVAVKRILPHLREDKQYRTMFLDESRVLAQLEHEAIIKTFEIGEFEDTPYIALEYVHGQDARNLFHRARRNNERVPIAVSCYIMTKVCDGLHHAHEQTDAQGELLGLVHRDVSLQNVLLSYDGDVKITDFGIAMSTENVARTEVGIVKGKFGYMSPEQIKGAPLDRRSDVFAAGICLYELLTGERLFSGESDYKAVERVRNVDVQLPSSLNREIPSALERIVMKALAKHPRDRYQSAGDMRRALQTFMNESSEQCDRAGLGEYMQRVFAEDMSSDAPIRNDLTPPPGQGYGSQPRAISGQGSQPHATSAGSQPRTATPTAGSLPPARRDRDPTPAPRNRTIPAPAAPPRATLPPTAAPTSLAAPPRKSRPNGPSTQDFEPLGTEQLQPVDALTGLAAFDDLDPVSSLNLMPDPAPAPSSAVHALPAPYSRPPQPSAASAISGLTSGASPASSPRSIPPGVARVPSVPPVVPRHESIPGNQPNALYAELGSEAMKSPSVPTLDMDWDEEEPQTQSQGLDEIPRLPDPMDEDVTRQVRVDDTFPGLRADTSGEFPPTLEASESSRGGTASASLNTFPAPARPGRNLAPVIVVVVAIVAAIVGALYLFRGPKLATVRLVTEPADAIVSLDGQPVEGSSSPFVINQVRAEVEHTISVDKPGFSSWSTQLKVHEKQVLELPKVTLEPAAGIAPEPSAANPAPSAPVAAEPAAAAPSAELVPTIEQNAVPDLAPPPAPPSHSAHSSNKTSQRDTHDTHATKASKAQAKAEKPTAKPKEPLVATTAKPKEPAAANGGKPKEAAAGQATLRINTRPWSKVFIDGKLIGNTPQMNISLKPGTHKIKLQNPDFGITKNLSLDLKPGETVTKVLTLQD